ncbi:MAG: pyridoxamine 5'-phosphate oxidase family protein [Gammaproteobacteria bacterium]
MNAPTTPLEDVAREARGFRDSFRTLHLATAGADGTPSASYAPFALSSDDRFQVYVSELAAHTANLLRGTPVSVLIIESEHDAAHLFARKRLTFTCAPQHCPRGSDAFEAVLAGLEERFGEFMGYLRTLTDFHAFTLEARHATYVRGFAQAYEFPDGRLETIRHVNDRGHAADDEN